MSKYVIRWDSWYVQQCMHEDVIKYGDGEHCVYFWEEDDTHEVFYVGSGKGYRFNCTTETARPPEFIERIKAGKCSPKIVAYGMTKEESFEFEKRLIKAYWQLGFDLINKQFIKEKSCEYIARAIRKQGKTPQKQYLKNVSK